MVDFTLLAGGELAAVVALLLAGEGLLALGEVAPTPARLVGTFLSLGEVANVLVMVGGVPFGSMPVVVVVLVVVVVIVLHRATLLIQAPDHAVFRVSPIRTVPSSAIDSSGRSRTAVVALTIPELAATLLQSAMVSAEGA